MLNLVGVTYAYYHDNLHIFSSMTTGNIELVFDDNYYVEPTKGIKNVKIDTNHNELHITADIKKKYEGVLHYTVHNVGSIPIEIKGKIIKPHEKKELTVAINAQFTDKKIPYIQWSH